MAASLGIGIVRGPVHFAGDEADRSGDVDGFWAAIRRGERLPVTEAPSSEQLAHAYAGEGPVVAVHVSSQLSRTVEHARAAAALRTGIEAGIETSIGAVAAEARVEVVDSRSLGVGTGLVAVSVAQAAGAGVECAELVRLARKWSDEMHVHAVIEDVAFLVKGGRAGLVAAKASGRGQRHVVAVKGHAIPIRQLRHRGEAIREMISHIREHVPRGATRWALGHGDAADVAEVVERLVAVFDSDPAWVVPLGPPVGAHMGPGAIAVGFASNS